jgi:hypothetical protein
MCFNSLILREFPLYGTYNGDLIVIIENNQLSETQMSSQTTRFRGDTLLQASVTANDIGMVIENVEIRLIKLGRQVRLGHGQTNGV